MARGKTEALFRTIRGEKYRLCLLSVDDTDKDGVPTKFTLIEDGESVDLRERDTFITAYIREDQLTPTSN